jgi:5-methylcytosine-specific restriction endonuclease McrA
VTDGEITRTGGRACGCGGALIEVPAPPPHHAGLRCGACGRHGGWLPKPENTGTRSDRNRSHRKAWRKRLGGALVCAICGDREGESAPGVDWHVDHLVPLAQGGADELWNTVPLCRSCHTIKGSIRAIRGRA